MARTRIYIQHPLDGLKSRHMEIVQGMAVTGLTLDEARDLLEMLPAAIADAERIGFEQARAKIEARTGR